MVSLKIFIYFSNFYLHKWLFPPSRFFFPVCGFYILKRGITTCMLILDWILILRSGKLQTIQEQQEHQGSLWTLFPLWRIFRVLYLIPSIHEFLGKCSAQKKSTRICDISIQPAVHSCSIIQSIYLLFSLLQRLNLQSFERNGGTGFEVYRMLAKIWRSNFFNQFLTYLTAISFL